MKRTFSKILLFLVLFTAFFVMPVGAQPLQSIIRVGILSNQPKVSISTNTNLKVLNADTGQVLGNFSAVWRFTT